MKDNKIVLNFLVAGTGFFNQFPMFPKQINNIYVFSKY